MVETLSREQILTGIKVDGVFDEKERDLINKINGSDINIRDILQQGNDMAKFSQDVNNEFQRYFLNSLVNFDEGKFADFVVKTSDKKAIDKASNTIAETEPYKVYARLCDKIGVAPMKPVTIVDNAMSMYAMGKGKDAFKSGNQEGFEDNFDKAIAFQKDILAQDDGNTNTNNNLGNMYAERGLLHRQNNQSDIAQKDFKEALTQYEFAIANGNVEAVGNRGFVTLLMGDKKKALDFYRTALKNNPHEINFAYNATQLCLDNNKIDEAFDMVENFYIDKSLKSWAKNAKDIYKNSKGKETFLSSFQKAINIGSLSQNFGEESIAQSKAQMTTANGINDKYGDQFTSPIPGQEVRYYPQKKGELSTGGSFVKTLKDMAIGKKHGPESLQEKNGFTLMDVFQIPQDSVEFINVGDSKYMRGGKVEDVALGKNNRDKMGTKGKGS